MTGIKFLVKLNESKKSFTELWVDKQQTNNYIRTIKINNKQKGKNMKKNKIAATYNNNSNYNPYDDL